MGRKCSLWAQALVVWYQLCGECWLLLLEGALPAWGNELSEPSERKAELFGVV